VFLLRARLCRLVLAIETNSLIRRAYWYGFCFAASACMVRLRCGLDEAAVIEVRSEAFPFLLDRMLCRLRLCVLLFPGDWVFLEHAHRCAVTGASWVTTRFNSLHTTVSAPRRSSTTWRTSPRAGALCTAIFWIAHAVQSLRLAVSRRLSFAGACSQMVGQCCFVGHEPFSARV